MRTVVVDNLKCSVATQAESDDPQAVLVYDGDCSFCHSCARWISRRWIDDRQRIVASQHLTPDQLAELGLSERDVRSAAWWVSRDGKRFRGHLAIGQTLRVSRGWPAVVGAMILTPPFRWVAAVAYPLIVRWRHRLPGGTPACRAG